MPICLKCNEKFPNMIRIDGKRKNLQNRKYCIQCSPFGSHNTKKIHEMTTQEQSVRSRGLAQCALCGKIYTGNGIRCSYCCVKIRRARIKLAGIKLLGGCCNRCGYKENPWVLDFHHSEDNKEFGISQTQNISWERMKVEMLKCELLCSNCHRAEHCSRQEEMFLEAVYRYDGNLDF